MTLSSRDKMIQSAAALMREQGLSGTSFRGVIEHSGAPRGSIYHHFPGGKFQLAEEAVRLSGDLGTTLITEAAAEGDPVTALRAFIALWRTGLEATEFRAGCPVVAAVAESPDGEARLLESAGEAFAAWCAALAASLRRSGVSSARSRRLATTTVAAVEGAVLLCRAQRDSGPLRDVGAELEELLLTVSDSSPRG